jgi:hypothetical protein
MKKVLLLFLISSGVVIYTTTTARTTHTNALPGYYGDGSYGMKMTFKFKVL